MGDAPPITKCRALIADLLPRRYPTLDRTARLLRLSTRTLQRRLRERGNSYSHLVETIRLERACRLLEEPGVTSPDIRVCGERFIPSSVGAFARTLPDGK